MAGNVIATLLVRIGVEVKEMNKGIKQVEGNLKGLKGSFKKVGSQIASVFSGKQVLGGIQAVMKATGEFQTELVGLGRIANISGQDLDNLGRQAMKMGSALGISSKEVVKGMADMAKLGYKTNEILSEMPSIMKFAKIKSLDFANALGLTESAMSVFKLGVSGAKKVTDAFLYTMDHSTASIDDLKLGFKYAAPAAKAAGLSIGELSAAIGILAKNGTTGSTAGTTLRMALNRLASDAPAVKKGLSDLGVIVTDSSGKFKPFKQIVEEMGKGLSGMSEKQQLATANMIFGTNAGSGMLKILKEGPGVFTEFANGAENAGGAVDKAFKDKQKTFEEAMNRMKSSFESLGIALGITLEPAITALVDLLTSLIDKFNELDPTTQAVIGYIAAAVAVFVLIGAAMSVVTFVVSGLTAACSALAAVFAFLLSPIGLVIIAVAAIAAAIVYLWNTNEGFRNALIAAWNGIKAFFSGIPGFFSGIWNTVVNATSNAFNAIKNKVQGIWNTIANALKSLASNAFTWGANLMSMLIRGITSKVSAIIATVRGVASKIKSFLGFSSPPDVGPLSQSDQWMPHFMNILSGGIERGIPQLQMAVGDVASTLDIGDAASSSSVINNINVSSRQNSLDERGLERMLDRMRILNGGTV